MCDPDYHEDVFRPTRECHECECGEELSATNPPERCDCGKDRCNECAHECEWCAQAGCESCMEDTVDGWAHTDQCAAELEASEDRKDAEWPETLNAIRKAG